jgi:hypothetical protein
LLAEFDEAGEVKALALFPLVLLAYVLGWIAVGLAVALNALAEAFRCVAEGLIGFLNWSTD